MVRRNETQSYRSYRVIGTRVSNCWLAVEIVVEVTVHPCQEVQKYHVLANNVIFFVRNPFISAFLSGVILKGFRHRRWQSV